MPWHHGEYPPSYKNLPKDVRDKAVEIANALLEENMPEGEAIAIGVKNAKSWVRKQKAQRTGRRPPKDK